MSDFSELLLVEQPAILLFKELGWETVSAQEESFGPAGTLGRDAANEAILRPRLRAALMKANPGQPIEAINAAMEELTRNRSAMSQVAANRETYELLKDGVKVTITDRESGGQKDVRVRVVDWANPAANDFLLVSQMTLTGALYTRRPDLVGFVNGLPWVVVELKKPGVPAKEAFDDNLTCYKADIPQLFWFNAFLVASNGTESKIGSLTADWERFFDWKRVEHEDEPRRVSLETMTRGTCAKERLLDLVENFTLFSEHKAGVVKILGQNHQFLGVNNAIAAMLEARRQGHGRGGVFWQTQGSGKSFSMVFFSQKILRKVAGNWSFVVVTDRIELDDQIAKTFKACGAVSEAESKTCHADSGAKLRQLLSGNHRFVFTLIHKFQSPETLCDRPDVVVMTDEAHRSQYDTLALNMRSALPKAMFVAFTGTPLIAGVERTREVFGDYVSRYDFRQSVEDGATVPLFYENRTPELRLENPDLNDEIYALIEDADLDESGEKKLERALGRQYHLLTRDDRLDKVAKDIVAHFLGRGFQGKAMVVSIDKATALKMHDKVRKHWAADKAQTAEALKGCKDGEKARELRLRLDILETTDMALIVSSGQNEIEQMKALGLDIAPHRKRMNDEALDEKFKDTQDPLRLVFVCAMWLTGFDAPSCSTVYLDKPIRNHTLMQTIARANRVFPGKHNGLIVDYANVFLSLEKALAIYGTAKGGGKDGERPVQGKAHLVAEMAQALQDADAACLAHGVSLDAILDAQGMKRLQLLADAVDALISPDPKRKEFLAHEKLVSVLYRAIKPDPAVVAFAPKAGCLALLAEAIREKTGGHVEDVSGVLADINRLLDASIASDGVALETPGKNAYRTGNPVVDLAKIDFEALARRFKKTERKHIEIEKLKAAIRARLDKLVQANRTRANYREKFEALIDSYNMGSRNIEDLFAELANLTKELDAEEARHVRENLTEEELAVFDLLTKPGPDLSVAERDSVKKAAKDLLAKIRHLMVLDWRNRQDARARVKETIEGLLDENLPAAYGPETYQAKCALVFTHVFEAYQEPRWAA